MERETGFKGRCCGVVVVGKDCGGAGAWTDAVESWGRCFS